MKNEHLRNKDLIAMKLRGGKDSHGGNKKTQNQQDRAAIRKKLASDRGSRVSVHPELAGHGGFASALPKADSSASIEITDPDTGEVFQHPTKCDRFQHCHTSVNDPSLLNEVDGRWLCAPCESFIRDMSAQIRDQQ